MNEQFEKLMYESGLTAQGCWDEMDSYMHDAIKQFAELIVRECINQAHSVGNLRGANDDMVYGADSAALQISKYFGVEE